MRVSYRWLGRHVDLSGLSPEEVAADLTLSTAEVEGVEKFAPCLSDVVVGHVLERGRHPDADKLSLCRVDVGSGEPLQIVCGGPNVAAGQKVAVATPGTKLPGDLVIKKSRIRGVDSGGMICSERELGLGEEQAGIWVLPPEAQVGRPVAPALGAEDWSIEIDNKSITHRPDLWGHRGVAAEIAAIHRRALKPLDLGLPAAGSAAPFPVRVESEACSRYVALCLEGARNGRSPDWLRFLLLAVGQRPLDLLVDLSNFAMLDLGQPNHLFDRRRLSPEGIVVRNARSGETMRTLDQVERRLEPSDLLICSGPTPVALAGIMGGEATKVADDTTSLVVEAATFRAATVRRTAARLGLRTDASARFEKTLDPNLALATAAHLVRLLQGLQPSVKLSAPPSDAGSWKDPARTIELRGERVRRLLGAEVPDAEIEEILVRLGFRVQKGAGVLHVRVPSLRASKDVSIEQDLVEEVGRIHRYGSIPERSLVATLAPPPRDERRAFVRRLEDRLAGAAAFHQTISGSFVAGDLLAKLGLAATPHVEVENPVAEGCARIRRSVVPSLLGLLEPNRRQRAEVRLFEIGKGYLPERSLERGEPAEVHELGLAWAAAPRGGVKRLDKALIARLQGIVGDLAPALGLVDLTWGRSMDSERPAWAHPGRCVAARFESGPCAALVAELEPGIKRALGLAGELSSEVAVAAVSVDLLLAAPRLPSRYRPVPRFPGVKVDVALAVPEATLAAELRAAIERAGKGLVASCELFDVYAGEGLGAGRKSLAWHVLLQAGDRTLTDQDGQKFLSRLEREAAGLSGELRRES